MVPSSVDVEGTDEVSVEIVNPEAISIGNDDGAMIIDFTGEVAEDIMGPDHDANLAEFIEEADLQSLASELIEDFISDRQSRKDWARAYVKGLDLLGMKIEERTQPWQGASGVFHPVLTEATVRFQAQAMGEIFPASGPVRVKLIGKKDYEKVKQGERVEHEMNYLLTEEMTEYRDETEQMLFRLPLAGSSFKKVYYDPIMERPCAMFVPAEDFVVSYGASDLNTCPRYTHVMKKTPNEIVELQVNGFYIDVDLPDPEPDISDIQEKYDEIEGEVAVLEEDDRHTLLEMHVDLLMPEPFEDKDGIARPYIVTIDKSSETILAIRRNWYEDDSKKRKRQHFVHYRYLPGLGFYGTGLIHLIGGLAKSATSILRQLIDAGTLSNLPAGLKARGLRIKGDDSPLMPGEFRDVDVPGGAIRDSIAFLPYKEPSSVLYQLLGNIVEEGRRIGSVADVQIGNLNPQAPVGTTLALMERSMKVMSGVQARLHHALKNELRLLANIIKDYMPSQYSYETDGDFNRQEDFDGRIDVIPVSDPNAATMSQRVVQYQAAMQLAQQAPHLYDLGKLHRQMLEVLGIKDAEEIIKLPDDIDSADPVSENMSILKQEPVKAFKHQDHEAHISVHLAAAEDPKLKEIVGQSPFAGAIQAALAAHITEHVAFQYRREIEKNLGVSMPDENAPLPDDVEVELSRLASQAAQKLLRKDQAEMQQKENQKQQQDPLTQIQQREMSLKEAEFAHKKEMDIAKLQADMKSKSENISMQKDRLASEEQREGAKLGIKIASELEQSQKQDIREGTEIGLEIARELSNRNGEE
jgi:post-segregation antitoxin (ccd killing protein)